MKSRRIDTRRKSALTASVAALGLLLFAEGCARNQIHAMPPTVDAPQPTTSPATIPPATTTKPADSPPSQPASVPNTAPASPATPPATPQPAAKPDAPAKKPVPDAPRPPAPEISPQMSPTDQASLARQTDQFVADAQKNLHRADGRALNASQHDMVEKIRGFLDQTREAIGISDWTRAKNLSEKAYLLSIELANSL